MHCRNRSLRFPRPDVRLANGGKPDRAQMATDPKLMSAAETSAFAFVTDSVKRQVQIFQDYTYLAARAVNIL